MIRNPVSEPKSTRPYKVVMLGDQAVGKSSVVNRFIKNEF